MRYPALSLSLSLRSSRRSYLLPCSEFVKLGTVEGSGLIASEFFIWLKWRWRAGNSSLVCGSMAGGAAAAASRVKAGRTNRAKAGPRQARRGEAAATRVNGTEQDWPALKKRNLTLQSRRELRGLDLFSVPAFLSAKECESFVQSAEALGFQQQGSLGPKFGEAFRDNGRLLLQSASIADKLWEAGLSSLFQGIMVDGRRAVGLNPNIRFYSHPVACLNLGTVTRDILFLSTIDKHGSNNWYVVGQRFGQHIDESTDLGGGRHTQYTLLIYLSGGDNSSAERPSTGQLVGGETVFYDRRRVIAEVPPVAGMALLHIHGEQCLLHEAKVVSKGIKYVLRSDVVFE